MSLSLSLPPRSEYIDHQRNIQTALDDIPCNLLHGTRSTTLIRMLDKNTPQDYQGCLLAQTVAKSLGITPGSGNFITLRENEKDLVHGGEAVSTVDIYNGHVAHDYATNPCYCPNPEVSFPVIFGIASSNSMEIKENRVAILALSERVIYDFTVAHKIDAKNIMALLVPQGKCKEVGDMIVATPLQHARIIGYPYYC